jgi:D-alanyl-D-alanine carboxypeptidase (penicillin-binding protein 5/6)
MKKIFFVFTALLLVCIFCTNLTAAAISDNPGKNPESFGNDTPQNSQKPERPFPKPPRGNHDKKGAPDFHKADPAPLEISGVKAKAAYLLEISSGKALFAQNENARYPIASMCKIMSLLIIYENLDAGQFKEDDDITISENASGMGGSQVFLETNGTYKISDLIKSIVIASANDATVAMAELIAGSEEGFVAIMNRRAKELNMNDTQFINCTGLPQPGQYSSAKDCSIMLSQLLKHSGYFKYSKIWMDKVTHSEGRITEISNTNKLVRFYKGCDGGKTGYTSEAKHCLSATAERGGMRLISVIIGAEDSKTRFAEASKLFNYGFANFACKQLVFKDKPLDVRINVKGGKEKTLEIAAQESYSLLTSKSQKLNYAIDYNIPDKVSAPIRKGDVVGSLSVIIDNKIVREISVAATTDIAVNSYGDCVGDIIHNW